MIQASIKIILIIIIVICSRVLPAQNNNIKFIDDNYTTFFRLETDNGLPAGKVLDIVQHPYGFIYIATINGLCRYDGYKTEIFVNQLNDTNTIPGNYVTSLAIDSLNNLWVGTKNGLSIFNNNRFINIPVQTSTTTGISNAYVRKVYYKKGKYVWAETVDGVLNQIDILNLSVKHFKHEKILASRYDYHSIFQDNNGTIWLGGRDIGPYMFDTTTSQFTLLKADPNNHAKKRDNDIACIYQDSKNRYWMCATDGFYQYFSHNQTFKKWLATSSFAITSNCDSTLFIGSGYGLYKFNIYTKTFTVYVNNHNNIQSLINNHINCLFIDINNNLWIGTNNGVSVLLQQNNLFRHYKNIAGNNNSLSNNNVTCFLQNTDTTVLIGTQGGGLNIWNYNNDNFTKLTDNNNHRFSNENISCLYCDNDDNIWIGLWSGFGFYKYQNKTNTLTQYALDKFTRKSDWYAAFYHDTNNLFWAGMWGASGVMFFNRQKGAFEPYILRSMQSPNISPLKKISVNNNIVFMQAANGLIHTYNTSNNTFCLLKQTLGHIMPYHEKHVKTKILNIAPNTTINQAVTFNNNTYLATTNGLFITDSSFLPMQKITGNNVFAILPLPNKNCFYSSNNGVYYYCNKSNKHAKIIEHKNLSINTIENNKQQIYLGTNNGILCYNTKTGKPDSLFNKHKSLIGNYVIVYKIKCTNTNNLWIATNNGLFFIDLGNTKKSTCFTVINSQNKGLITNTIYDLAVDTLLNKIWLATDKGLITFNISQKTFEQTNTILHPVYGIAQNNNTLWLATENGLFNYNKQTNLTGAYNSYSKYDLTSRLTKFITPDSIGNIWVGTTDNGLNIVDKNTYSITHFLSNPTDTASLWGNETNSVAAINKNTVWAGTQNGITVFTNYKPNKHITTNNGLPHNSILGLVTQPQNLVWAVTPKGLVLINTNSYNIVNFADNFGLKPSAFNGAIYKLKNNNILLGTNNGFYCFNTNKVKNVLNKNTPKVTGFKVFNKYREVDFTTQNSIVLNHDENFFTIEFSLFAFNQNKTNYTYKLVNIDPQWVTTTNNYATYTKVRPGRYSFLVTTQNNIEPYNFNIIITPPLWQKTWFIILEIILALLLIGYLYYRRIKQFKFREKHILLEQKMLRSQMNPHFVFNALIAIQSFIFKNDPKEAGRYLSKFAKLMRLFLNNSRSEFIVLNNEIDTITNYMELQKLRFDNNFDFEITCHANTDPEKISIPPMLTQPFIENAIEHGFNGITYKGYIKVNFCANQNWLDIVITDNGKGVDNTVNTNKNHQSLATIITRERLSFFSNKNTTYKLIITNNNKTNINQTGTTVTIQVPYKTEF